MPPGGMATFNAIDPNANSINGAGRRGGPGLAIPDMQPGGGFSSNAMPGRGPRGEIGGAA